MSILLVKNAIYSTETKEILGQTANIQSEYKHTFIPCYNTHMHMNHSLLLKGLTKAERV